MGSGRRFTRRALLGGGGLLAGGLCSPPAHALVQGAGGWNAPGPPTMAGDWSWRLQPAATAIDIRELGARGDGSQDDTPAFREAFRAAASQGAHIVIPPGVFRVSDLEVPSNLLLEGIPGASIMRSQTGKSVLSMVARRNVVCRGITFQSVGEDTPEEALVTLSKPSSGILFENCSFYQAKAGLSIGSGVAVDVVGCSFNKLREYGILSRSSERMRIAGNRVTNCGSAGIKVSLRKRVEADALIEGNFVKDITTAASDIPRGQKGNWGEHGNGIVAFRANGVIIQGNTVRDCSFSAIRVVGSEGCQVLGNNCKRFGGRALWAEFAFQGCVIANNYVEDAGYGFLSVTNFGNAGGRLAVVTGNIFRGQKKAWGVKLEADILFHDNVLEDGTVAIAVGTNQHLRDVSVKDNLIRNFDYGILVSNNAKAGRAYVSGNIFTGIRKEKIAGSVQHKKGPEPRPRGNNIVMD
ncbi:MAG: TIGR03808 family TAT-translocated repetitive protein [Erythrobacter sp.]|nr:TIGR03808 family TAT-translocated repetitive protein [Erythrobacter sp.]